MIKLSVVVPIYNTNNCLKKCLWSIANQTYKNIEIVCVDDGSTDGSELIVDEFAKQDNRFVVIHQRNAGESNARNIGLKHATGDYISFCDCDDWLELNMYEELITEIEKDNLDFIASSWIKELTQETVIIQNKESVAEQIFSRDELLRYLYMRDSYRAFAYMWNKIYSREILMDEGELLLFDESLKLGGDVLYLAKAALNVRRGRYIDKAYYHYNQRLNSGCHTTNVDKLKDWITAYERVMNLFEQHQVSENIIAYVKRFIGYHSSNFVEIAIAHHDDNAKQYFQSIMKQHEREYVQLNFECADRIERYRRLLQA